MGLANKINPLVRFIHHSEENADDPEDEKRARREATAKAYMKTFGRVCPWHRELDSTAFAEVSAQCFLSGL